MYYVICLSVKFQCSALLQLKVSAETKAADEEADDEAEYDSEEYEEEEDDEEEDYSDMEDEGIVILLVVLNFLMKFSVVLFF